MLKVVMSLSQNTRLKLEKYNSKNPIDESILYNRYIEKFKNFKKPLTTKEISEQYKISVHSFDKFLSRLFRIGLIFIFEKRPIGKALLKNFGLEWGKQSKKSDESKQIQYYYLLIPQTSKAVIEYNIILDRFYNTNIINLINSEKVWYYIRNITNSMAKYEVLALSKKFKIKKLRGFILQGQKVLSPGFISPVSAFFSKVGYIDSFYGQRLIEKITENLSKITSYFYDKKTNLLEIIDPNYKIKKRKKKQIKV